MSDIDDDVIRGKDNTKVKYLRSLHDRKKAQAEGVVFVEGVRLCEDALKSGIVPRAIAFTSDNRSLVKDFVSTYKIESGDIDFLCLSDDNFVKICSTVNPQGVAMIVPNPVLIDSNIPFVGDGKDIFVVLEELQDPGNMGTIIRLADAFSFTAVILLGNTVDPFNEKVLRSSMGSCWHIPLVKITDYSRLTDFFLQNKISRIAMHLKGEKLSATTLELPAAYFIGNEGNGLSNLATGLCDKMVKIPMQGKAESLNAASAASIIGYLLSNVREQ